MPRLPRPLCSCPPLISYKYCDFMCCGEGASQNPKCMREGGCGGLLDVSDVASWPLPGVRHRSPWSPTSSDRGRWCLCTSARPQPLHSAHCGECPRKNVPGTSKQTGFPSLVSCPSPSFSPSLQSPRVPSLFPSHPKCHSVAFFKDVSPGKTQVHVAGKQSRASSGLVPGYLGLCPGRS